MYFGKRVQLMLAVLFMNSASVGPDFQGFSQPKKDPYLQSSLGSGDGWGIGWDGEGGLEHLLFTGIFYYTQRFLVHNTLEEMQLRISLCRNISTKESLLFHNVTAHVFLGSTIKYHILQYQRLR